MEGREIPSVVFKTRIPDEASPGQFCWRDVRSEDVFTDKRIVLFALPGAFTPTCSALQLPGYETLYDDFKRVGVDEVYCLSVNDAFVMNSWRDALKASKVKFLPDGSGDFTRAVGMLVKKNNLGFGERSWRYSIHVEDGRITKAFVEPGLQDNCPVDPFEVSDARTMLAFLGERAK